jgi:dTDP-glucose 4,6-dehydratase
MAVLLITGGAGFIGVNFVHYWRRTHERDQIVVLDALTYAGNLASLGPLTNETQVRFVRGDICDEALVEELFEQHSFDIVVHFAAESHVDRSIAAPDDEPSRQHATRAMARHHISTDEVYGSWGPDDRLPPKIRLTRPVLPCRQQGSQRSLGAYANTYGLVTSQLLNNYGPYSRKTRALYDHQCTRWPSLAGLWRRREHSGLAAC